MNDEILLNVFDFVLKETRKLIRARIRSSVQLGNCSLWLADNSECVILKSVLLSPLVSLILLE